MAQREWTPDRVKDFSPSTTKTPRMHPLATRFFRQTSVGLAVIAVGVPFLQGKAFGFTQHEPPSLRITGDVGGLSVTRPGRLVLTVTNPGGSESVVHHLTAAPERQIHGCALTVEPYDGELVVPAHGSTTHALVVRIAGPRCVGATWQLVYGAS